MPSPDQPHDLPTPPPGIPPIPVPKDMPPAPEVNLYDEEATIREIVERYEKNDNPMPIGRSRDTDLNSLTASLFNVNEIKKAREKAGEPVDPHRAEVLEDLRIRGEEILNRQVDRPLDL